jgi:hypothetical protein
MALTAIETGEFAQGVKACCDYLSIRMNGQRVVVDYRVTAFERFLEAGDPDEYVPFFDHMVVGKFFRSRPEQESPDPLATLIYNSKPGQPFSAGLYFLLSFHRRICDSASLSAEIKKAIGAASAQGIKITAPTIDTLTVQAATTVALAIATTFNGPIAVAMAPLLGGVALLLMRTGLDAFCSWARDSIKAAEAKLMETPAEDVGLSRKKATRKSTVGPKASSRRKQSLRKIPRKE